MITEHQWKDIEVGDVLFMKSGKERRVEKKGVRSIYLKKNRSSNLPGEFVIYNYHDLKNRIKYIIKPETMEKPKKSLKILVTDLISIGRRRERGHLTQEVAEKETIRELEIAYLIFKSIETNVHIKNQNANQ